jgi:hypothetical protein
VCFFPRHETWLSTQTPAAPDGAARRRLAYLFGRASKDSRGVAERYRLVPLVALRSCALSTIVIRPISVAVLALATALACDEAAKKVEQAGESLREKTADGSLLVQSPRAPDAGD